MGNVFRRYGVPYQGSKNAIVPWVMSYLPAAVNFVDVFAGGCAITHGALLSGKYRHFIVNDLSDAPQLFLDAVHGKFKDEKRWITREQFFELKDKEPYIKYCWSFGMIGTQYIYGDGVYEWKRALHWLYVYGDDSLMRRFGIDRPNITRRDILENAEYYRQKYFEWSNYQITVKQGDKKDNVAQNESLARLCHVQRLQSLESLQCLQKDYRSLDIPPQSLVYCDPPYRGTCQNGYGDEVNGKFDYDAFYDWAEKQAERNIVVISEYNMPAERFECIGKRYKACTMGTGNVNQARIEKLFVPKCCVAKYWRQSPRLC